MPDEGSLPDDILELMKAFGVEPASGRTPPPKKDSPAPGSAPAPGPAAPEPAGKKPSPRPGAPAEKPQFETFGEAEPARTEASLDLLKDVMLSVRVEIGRARIYVQDILRLGPGSVVELDRLTGDPLDLYVNDRLVARGEVLVINENFAIRITEVIHPGKQEKK